MKKNFVLDTNVLLHDPARDLPLRGQQRHHPDLRPRGDRPVQEGAVRAGAQRPRGGAPARRVPPDGRHLSEGVAAREAAARCGWRSAHRDAARRAQGVADGRQLHPRRGPRGARREPDSPTILVTKDVNLRIRADALGLNARGLRRREASTSRSSTPATPRSRCRRRAIDKFYSDGRAAARGAGQDGYYANQYLLLRDRDNPSHTALGRFDGAHEAGSRRSRSCARACGASGRATRSSTTRSTCCSTTTSSW